MAVTLQHALSDFCIELAKDQISQLDRYCHLLWEWNKKLNLTRHTDYERFITRDLTDSMVLAELLQSDEEILDWGTGGGVPGVLIAILRPDLQVSLCESVRKKATVIDSIVSDLGLPVPVYHARGEDLVEDFRFNTIVARAVGPLAKVLQWMTPHWNSVDRLLLTKGPRWVDERANARHRGLLHSFDLRCVKRYPMPGTDSESVVLEIRPKRNK